jgi:hypothetical protein
MVFMEQERKPVPPDPFPNWLPPGFKPVMRDETLEHQISLCYAPNGYGGTGVVVKCNCTQPGDPPFGERCITDLDDAWELYAEHLMKDVP